MHEQKEMAKSRSGRGDNFALFYPFSFSPLFLALLFGFLLALPAAAAAADESRRQEPNAAERAISVAAAATGTAWEAFRSWIKLRVMNFPEPTTDRVSRSKSETVKEAAARSFQAGKSAAEDSARSAARAARVAETLAEKTASKVKRSASSAMFGGDEDSDL